MNEFSKRILSAIEESGLSYCELSKLTGISKSALQRYATGETSKVPIDRIEKIAKFTNVSVAHLMGWESENLTFSKRLLFLRTRSGLTQEALVESINKKYNLNFNKSMISKWENGHEEASASSAKFLSDFFNVSLDYLFCLTNTEKTDKVSPNILKYYNNLNELGKREAEKRMRELTFIPEYTSSGDVYTYSLTAEF